MSERFQTRFRRELSWRYRLETSNFDVYGKPQPPSKQTTRSIIDNSNGNTSPEETKSAKIIFQTSKESSPIAAD